MGLLVSILPVAIFLIFLFLLDTFKLVIKRYLFLALLWGIISAVIAYLINNSILDSFSIKLRDYSLYIAPVIEELIKTLFVLWMFHKKKMGFMIDAAIYGFAVGSGFSLVENFLYYNSMTDANPLIWIIRGFGTAFMHGGCTSLFAVILIGAKSRNVSNLFIYLISLLFAYIIHSAFNHMYIDPVIQTIGIIIVLPVFFILIFGYNEKQLRSWLEIEFSSEIELLNMINKGQLRSTRSGEYLESLKSRVDGEAIIDMYCYLRIYLELSIKAKRNVMLKESGFSPIFENDIKDKLLELAHLRRQIGKVGELMLSPLIRMNYRDLWKLNTLKD